MLEEARRVLKIEAQCILDLVERLNGNFETAAQLILKCKGKLIITGIGKSGHVARKIASTFASTGTPAIYLHPAESSHGDLGVIAPGDLVMALSYGGESAELAAIVNYLARKDIPLIAMTGNPQSSLAQAGKVVLDAQVKEEACPLGLAPTASSTLMLAMGDALAMTVLKAKGFGAEDFAEFHPGGKLGRKLLTRVKDVMHIGEALPLVKEDTEMSKVIGSMTAKEVRGVAGVTDAAGSLIGIITDGDIRRRLEKSPNPLKERAIDVMSRNPKTIDANELAEKALFVMEQFRIQTLFVIDKGSAQPQQPVGLIHLQDLLKAKVR